MAYPRRSAKAASKSQRTATVWFAKPDGPTGTCPDVKRLPPGTTCRPHPHGRPSGREVEGAVPPLVPSPGNKCRSRCFDGRGQFALAVEAERQHAVVTPRQRLRLRGSGPFCGADELVDPAADLEHVALALRRWRDLIEHGDGSFGLAHRGAIVGEGDEE